jgi:hypothetical protein
MNAGETTPEATPVVQWPDPPANTLERAAEGQEHARNEVQDSGALDERPVKQSVVAVGNLADSPTLADMHIFLFTGALAVIGFLVRVSINIVAARRRRAGVCNADLRNSYLERSTTTVGGISFTPLRPMEPIHRHDEVEEVLRQFSQVRQRRRLYEGVHI